MAKTKTERLSDKTLVFSGPTLSGLGDLRASLAGRYVFHPPIRCGNLLEAYREGYRRVVIIDGFFERVAAVWHKEILYFMNRGGRVAGCSSMGALRAIELERYGMLGFGRIVDDFRSGKITDDDEVAVAHLGLAQDFLSVTDAMVNIRYTIEDAVSKGALERVDAGKILAVAKSAFYKKRNLKLFAREVLADQGRLERFQKYLEQNGLIDQKRADALALLERTDIWSMADAGTDKTPKDPEPLSDTAFLQTLRYLQEVNPPALEKQALSSDSRFLKLGRLLVGKQYHLMAKLAGAMMHYFNLVKDAPPRPFSPVSWLNERWWEGDEKLPALIGSALEACPQYASGAEVPSSVRHLCLSIEFPIEYLKLSIPESHGTSISTNAILNYSRILYLTGLFLDARLAVDPVAKRVVPKPKSVELRAARYTLRGYESEADQRDFLATFGLENLAEACAQLERNAMLLTETDKGVSFGFFEEGTYWYKMAAQATGVWAELLSLADKKVRASFSQELSEDLKGMTGPARTNDLLLAGLPTQLLDAQSVLKYIGDQLDP